MLPRKSGYYSFKISDAESIAKKANDDPSVHAKIDKAIENEMRWVRIMANDLENIPIGLINAWGMLLFCESPVVHKYAVISFAIARLFERPNLLLIST